MLIHLQVGAGFTNDDGVKVAVSSQELAPAGIILDAELTLATPERLWYVGFLCAWMTSVSEYLLQVIYGHQSTRSCCWWIKNSNIICNRDPDRLPSENLYRPLITHPQKVLCYAALADLFKYLPESKADPSSVEIRQRLQIASWMSLWPIKLEKYRYVMQNTQCSI